MSLAIYWTNADWTAAGTVGLFLVALVAAFIALRQYRSGERARIAQAEAATAQIEESRRIAEEESRPYVVATLELDAKNPHMVYIVIQNYGRTVARDVRTRVTPTPRRAGDGSGGTEEVWLPDVIPALAPGQEWRTLWDFYPERARTGLPDRHEAVVEVKDGRGNPLPPNESVLDWAAFKGRMWITERTIHDAAEALREIQKSMAKWTEDIHGSLAVFTRDGDEKDRQERERRAQQTRAFEERQAERARQTERDARPET